MKQFISMALLFVLASVAMAQKSPHTIMAVFAHSDDDVFIGPLLAHYARQGTRIHEVIMTQGTTGRRDASHHGIPNGPELARARAEEAHCSCRELRIEPPVILAFENLGKQTRPPWDYLAQAEHEIRRLFGEIRPEVVITFGPEGGYGHPDHRLVADVVSQIVQSADGAPVRLFYFGFPKDRLSWWRGEEPLVGVDPSYLTVRVPYSKDDFAVFRKSFSCYKTQFLPKEMESYPNQLDQVWGGRMYLRPWFDSVSSDDIFTLKKK